MTFEEDLTKRRIDVNAFAAGDPEKFAAWQLYYQQVHPNTFYTSVKMIINDVRRRFWLAEAPKPAVTAAPIAAKPVVRRAPVPVPSTASAIPDEPSPSVDRTPEPAPRGRAVIRRAPVNPSEMPIANTAAENKSETEANLPVTLEATDIPTEAAKPVRPRPVIRKPAVPLASADTANTTSDQAKVNPAELPEHSNPNPTEVPKPPRPRPVFKRPTPATPPEAESRPLTPEESGIITSPPDPVIKKTGEKNPESVKRPRPIFKRPGTVNLTENLEKPPLEATPENNPKILPVADTPTFHRPQPIIKRSNAPIEPVTSGISATPAEQIVNTEPELINPVLVVQKPVSEEIGTTAETISPEIPPGPKPPRPRPVFKSPSKPESPEGAADQSPEKNK